MWGVYDFDSNEDEDPYCGQDWSHMFSLDAVDQTITNPVEMNMFRWTRVNFLESKRHMQSMFDRIYGLYRHSLVLSWKLLAEIYDVHEATCDLPAAEYAVYNRLWSSYPTQKLPWDVHVRGCVADIFHNNSLTVDKWLDVLVNPIMIIAICKHLDCRAIRSLKQISRKVCEVHTSVNRTLYRRDFPTKYEHGFGVCGTVHKMSAGETAAASKAYFEKFLTKKRLKK